MNHSDMLQRMCHSVLAKTDLKAIVKSRGLPQTATNAGILAGLFLTDQGVADAMKSLDRKEIGLLHMLRAVDKPVNVSFFGRVYEARRTYGSTFTQKYSVVLAKVKERLVRTGVLLMCDVPSRGDDVKMELWRFAFPVQFHPYLPPLLESTYTCDGSGDFRPDAVREKLRVDLGSAAPATAANSGDIPSFQIASGELWLGEARFQVSQLAGLRSALWAQRLGTKKQTSASKDSHDLQPTDAVFQLLASLKTNEWADVEQLTEFAQVFSAQKVDCHLVCEAGWQIGALAKIEAEGKCRYRHAPAEPALDPSKTMKVLERDKCVAVDLSQVPFEALETLVQLSDVRLNPSGLPSLLLTPNLVRIGRASDDVLASDSGQWLFQHSQVFGQAHALLISRRGKTVLHSNVLIARVTDLSLKVALEKALGESWISLKNDYGVFPRSALSDVQRIVKKSGHVIKEVAGNDR